MFAQHRAPRPVAAPAPHAAGTAEDSRLLVALTGSDHDRTLLSYAAHWAAPPRLPAAGEDTDTPLGMTAVTAPLGPTWRAGLDAHGPDLFVRTPRAVQALTLPTGHKQASAELLRYAAAAGTDTLMVGERSLARELIRLAPCSVWFVPAGARPMPRRLLVPVDFSIRSADSLRVAALLARLGGAASCVALHVYFNDSVLTGAWGEAAAAAAVQAAYQRFMKPIDTLGVAVTPCFHQSYNVARTIDQTAADMDCDLVVLASRGRTWSASLLQAGIAAQTLQCTQAPVLVVKHFGAVRGLFRLLSERLRSPANELRCN